MATIAPVFGLVGGLLKESTISPFFENEYLLAGFAMQADLPPSVVEEIIEIIQ